MADLTTREGEKALLKQRILGMNKLKGHIADGKITDKDILSLVTLFDPKNNNTRIEPVHNHTESGGGGMAPSLKITLDLDPRQHAILSTMMKGQADMMPGAEPWTIEKSDTTKGGTLTVRTFGDDNYRASVLTAHDTKAKYQMMHTLLRYMATTQIYKIDPLNKPAEAGQPHVSGQSFRNAKPLDKLILGERVMVQPTGEIKRTISDALTGLDHAVLMQEYNDNRNEPSRMRERWIALQTGHPGQDDDDEKKLKANNVQALTSKPKPPAEETPQQTRKIG
jgi:hypothetical protein